MYISYATKFDGYTGTKDWNELALIERKTIVESEFNNADIDIEEYVMSTGLKKIQFAGIRALYVASLMLNERMGLVDMNRKSSTDKDYLLGFFGNTKFLEEVTGLINNTALEKTIYNGKELELIAFTSKMPSVLDATLDMDIDTAREFIKRHLEPLTPKRKAVVETQKITPLKFSTMERKRASSSFFDMFVCAEVRWIRVAIRDFFNQYKTLANEQILKECLRLASNSDKAKYSIRVEQMKPEQIALILIRNVAQEQLVTGRNHIYRGTLSLIGAEYKKIFLTAIARSVEFGFTSEEEAKSEIDEINVAIQDVG